METQERERADGDRPIDRSDLVRVEARVEGDVQGVNYRNFVQMTARTLGVAGWVRNQSDGSVTVVAEATPETMEEFLGHVRKGSSSAQVTDVQVEEKEAEGAPDPFEIRG
jgi:acylphosphatase